MNNLTIEELSNKTLAQLRDIAKELNIKSISKYKKSELIEIINGNTEKSTSLDGDKKNEDNSENKHINVNNKEQDNPEEITKSERTYVRPSYNKVESQNNGKYIDNRNQRAENRTQNNDYTKVQGIDNRQPRNNNTINLTIPQR